jgi:hypothetical protein
MTSKALHTHSCSVCLGAFKISVSSTHVLCLERLQNIWTALNVPSVSKPSKSTLFADVLWLKEDFKIPISTPMFSLLKSVQKPEGSVSCFLYLNKFKTEMQESHGLSLSLSLSSPSISWWSSHVLSARLLICHQNQRIPSPMCCLSRSLQNSMQEILCSLCLRDFKSQHLNCNVLSLLKYLSAQMSSKSR